MFAFAVLSCLTKVYLIGGSHGAAQTKNKRRPCSLKKKLKTKSFYLFSLCGILAKWKALLVKVMCVDVLFEHCMFASVLNWLLHHVPSAETV